jgi:hypothetical protein
MMFWVIMYWFTLRKGNQNVMCFLSGYFSSDTFNEAAVDGLLSSSSRIINVPDM